MYSITNKNMKSININIHSFVDLITNSSSVVYVMASESTITAIKDVVNSVLKLSHSDLTADQLFNFELYKEYEESSDTYVKVTAKVQDDTAAVNAAVLLSKLESLFDLEGGYDG